MCSHKLEKDGFVLFSETRERKGWFLCLFAKVSIELVISSEGSISYQADCWGSRNQAAYWPRDCVVLGKQLSVSQPQFPALRWGNNNDSPASVLGARASVLMWR